MIVPLLVVILSRIVGVISYSTIQLAQELSMVPVG
nr:MAG TPA: hypothetical protein [Caudoviricetes sp.]